MMVIRSQNLSTGSAGWGVEHHEGVAGKISSANGIRLQPLTHLTATVWKWGREGFVTPTWDQINWNPAEHAKGQEAYVYGGIRTTSKKKVNN